MSEQVKLMEGEKIGEIGLIRTFMPHEDCGIDWSKVPEDFKEDYMATWETAMEILDGKHDTNRGHNIISVLEKMGQMINEDKIEEHWDFDLAYDKAAEVLIEEFLEQ